MALGTAVAVLAAACSKGGGPAAGGTSLPSPRPSSTATIAFVAPTNGAVVTGPTVHVVLSLVGGKIVPATTTNLRPDQGHVHLLLDGKLVSMNYGLTDNLANVPPGEHTLRAEFVASDHAPFDPRVFSAIVFEVQT